MLDLFRLGRAEREDECAEREAEDLVRGGAWRLAVVVVGAAAAEEGEADGMAALIRVS